MFLSGPDEQTMVGNFIGDYVKGNAWNKYPENIKKGILMHRRIDSFTDTHPKFREAKSLFRNEFGLYSGIVIDLLYDHYLAKNWNEYSDITLRTFAKRSHAVLLQNFMHLPLKVQSFLPFLIQHKRLESYASAKGIVQTIKIMSNYSSLPAKSEFVMEAIQTNNDFFEVNFREFMFDLREYTTELQNNEITKSNSSTVKQT